MRMHSFAKAHRRKRGIGYVYIIIYNFDACNIWKAAWFCTEGHMGNNENHFLDCVASDWINRSCGYGIDVDCIAGSFDRWYCINLCM